MQCILSGQYVLADRFLRNSSYLVEREILSTFWCQFPSKRGFLANTATFKAKFKQREILSTFRC